MAKTDDSVRIKFRNTSNGILRFKFPNPDRSRRNGMRKLHTDERLILGAAQDEVLPPGIPRGPRCPSPLAEITLADWRRLGRANQTGLLSYAVRGVVLIECDLDELPVDPAPPKRFDPEPPAAA